ncbi:MAG: hypothetical protein WBP29_05145, partial [Candidatus Zixiibacteriota bacterium]
MKNKIILALAVILLASTQVFAFMSFRLEDPTPGLQSNSVTQILYDGEYVWMATGAGLAGSSNGGQTWFTFNDQNAFTENGISAIGKTGPNLLTATADIDASQAFGAGLYLTLDRGVNWTRVSNPLFAGLGRLSYDFTVYDSVVYSSNNDAGLMRSFDDGVTWEQIFATAEIESIFVTDSTFQRYSNDPHLEALSFSNLIDPYHDDTTIVWNGSAEGIQRYYYIGQHKKLASRRVNDIANVGDTWWYATDRGISKFNDTLLVFNTYDTDNGLPANFVTAIAAKDDIVVAGLYDTLAQSSLGFAISTDAGASWTHETPAQATGANRKIEDIKFFGDGIWVATNLGGLINSTDNGNNWTRFYPPVSDTIVDKPFHHVHGIDVGAREDFSRIAVGTDSGIVALYFNASDDFDSAVYLPIFDNTLYSQKVVSLSSFVTQFGDEYWAAVQPYR